MVIKILIVIHSRVVEFTHRHSCHIILKSNYRAESPKKKNPENDISVKINLKYIKKVRIQSKFPVTKQVKRSICSCFDIKGRWCRPMR